MGLIFSNNNRPEGFRYRDESGYLTHDDNNCIVFVENAATINFIISAALPPGFHCILIVKSGLVSFTAEGTTLHGSTGPAAKYQWIEICSPLPNVFVLTAAGSGGGGGNTTDTVGSYKLINLLFDGQPGSGEVGEYNLDPLLNAFIDEGVIIDELIFDAFPLMDRLASPGLTAGVGAYITFGIDVDGPDCGLDAETGLVETLNENKITKIITPRFDKSTLQRNFVMSVGGADITNGYCTILVKTLKLN